MAYWRREKVRIPHPSRSARSLALGDWVALAAIPGVRLVNLQYGDTSEERATVHREMGLEIHQWEDADPLRDLDGFAAQIAALDLVISIDNATVHMAGAVGTPASRDTSQRRSSAGATRSCSRARWRCVKTT